MPSRVIRQWTAFVVALALCVGLMGHGLRAAQMDVRTAATAVASDMGSCGDCNCCGAGGTAMPSAGCFAFCGGSIVAVLPGAILVSGIAIERAMPMLLRPRIGRADAPEPYPPKRAA